MERHQDPGGHDGGTAAGVEDLSLLRHDLNNSLTAIFGLVDLILMKETTISPEGRRRLEMIAGSCSRMLERLDRTRRSPGDAESPQGDGAGPEPTGGS